MHDLRKRLRSTSVSRRAFFQAPALALVLAIILALGPACGGETPAEEPDADVTEPPRPPRPPTSRWTTSTIEDGHVGLHVRMDVSAQGTIGVAYYVIEHEVDGVCDEFEVDNPPMKLRWTLRYGQFDGSQWNVEDAARPAFPSMPSGLDFKFSPQGAPILAAMAGDPVWQGIYGYCGANNAALYHREGRENWRVETAVSNSNEAATGNAASDFGFVVGYWPALAFSAAGEPAIVYKDVHAGSIQRDDYARADLEFARRQGSRWSATPVDWGAGAGNYNRLIFDADDVPVVAYYKPTESNIEERIGIWVARESAPGADWDQVHLFKRGTPEGPDIVLHPETGDLHVVFYDSRMGNPQLATLSDATSFASVAAWEFEDLGNPNYDEGYTPSIAIAPTGEVAVAYYRCTRAAGTLGDCKNADDGLIFAWKDGAEWKQEVVDAGGQGACGNRPSLRFDSEGRPIIAYRCEDLVDGQVDARVKFARREALR